MNHEARIRRLEAQTNKATINTWVDLVSYSGPFPVMVSDEMAPLFTGAIHEPGRKTQETRAGRQATEDPVCND
jgi:hypothetical protein